MRQLMVRHVPEQRPTPTVAPVMHCVVETGSSVLRSASVPGRSRARGPAEAGGRDGAARRGTYSTS